jgi:large subunit ribosomal protein L25
MITLDAVLRDVKVSPKMIRKQGLIPAVFYGAGQTTTSISVDKIKFRKVLEEAGESSIISLKTPNGVLEALIHDIGLDPVIGDPVHVDFYIVAKGHKLEVDVPIEFVGIAPAEKLGGIVMKILHEIRIESLPGKLPQHITVDLSALTTLESHITVADLKLGDGVRALIGEHEVVAGITLPKEEVEAPVAPIDLSSIEVSQKGKKEETEEEAAS